MPWRSTRNSSPEADKLQDDIRLSHQADAESGCQSTAHPAVYVNYTSGPARDSRRHAGNHLTHMGRLRVSNVHTHSR